MSLKIISVFALFIASYHSQAQIDWKFIDEGLHYAEVLSPSKSDYGDSRISILKIDPNLLDLKLIGAKELKTETKTVDEWGEENNLIAAVNAGMFLSDGITNRDFMKNYDFLNNPTMSADNAVVAFNPIDDSVPSFQIIDMKCEDWPVLKTKYHTLIQGIRMIDCNSTNRWSDQPQRWSMVIIAEDNAGNALFIFTRSPYKVHDFVNILLDLPLGIVNAMYLEGGPEASFFLDHSNLKVTKMGSYETGFYESDDNDYLWDIPNVIGVVRK